MQSTIFKLTRNTAWYTFVNITKLLAWVTSVFVVMEVAGRVNSEHGIAVVIAAIVIGYAFYSCYAFAKMRREREVADEQRMMERLSN